MNAMAKTLYVFNETRQCFLSLNVTAADTHLSRLRGLIGRKRLHGDEGIWLAPCQGVHTFGMSFPIDVVYLDARNLVVHVIEHLGPFRLGPLRVKAKSVLELPTRTIYTSGTQVGDYLRICTPEEMQLEGSRKPSQHHRTGMAERT
jgi:uncharacterized protein